MMKLTDGMLLFHGSYARVGDIDLNMCIAGKDFGQGFYLTSDLNQARSFIKTSAMKAQRLGYANSKAASGFVSSFRFHMKDDLKIFQFDSADKEWLWFIAQNRRANLAEVLADRVNPDLFSADVIIGKVANDKTNATITAYLNGLYGDVLSERAVNFAIEELLPNQLEDQFCFLNEKAISCLEFREAREYAI